MSHESRIVFVYVGLLRLEADFLISSRKHFHSSVMMMVCLSTSQAQPMVKMNID